MWPLYLGAKRVPCHKFLWKPTFLGVRTSNVSAEVLARIAFFTGLALVRTADLYIYVRVCLLRSKCTNSQIVSVLKMVQKP